MPLSKARNRERMRAIRLHKALQSGVVQPEQEVIIPLYNPSIHRAGDTVRVIKGRREIVTTIPELDIDGNIIPELP